MHLVSFFHFKTKTKSVVYIYGAKFKNCTMCTENRKTGFIDIWGVLEGSNTLSNHQRPLHVVLSKTLISNTHEPNPFILGWTWWAPSVGANAEIKAHKIQEIY